jgi:hypothetical protein
MDSCLLGERPAYETAGQEAVSLCVAEPSNFSRSCVSAFAQRMSNCARDSRISRSRAAQASATASSVSEPSPIGRAPSVPGQAGLGARVRTRGRSARRSSHHPRELEQADARTAQFRIWRSAFLECHADRSGRVFSQTAIS